MTVAELTGSALAAWACVAALMVAMWLVQRRIRNAGIVDVAWSAALAALAVALAALVEGPVWRRVLLGALGGLWGLRLAVHLGRRVIGREEDGRYRALRRDWGAGAQRNLFLFYQAQAFTAALFALPFLAVLAKRGDAFGLWDAVGIGVWVAAVGGEALADAQLARFRADAANRGRICDHGLWGWSRHPNYFFEWLHWWSYVALAAGSPYFWLSFAGPVAMLHFLVHVTGIPTVERRMLETRGAAFRDYRRRVSAFVPWPPAR